MRQWHRAVFLSKAIVEAPIRGCELEVCAAFVRYWFPIFLRSNGRYRGLFRRQSHSRSFDRTAGRDSVRNHLSNVQSGTSVVQHVSERAMAGLWRSDGPGRFGMDPRHLSALHYNRALHQCTLCIAVDDIWERGSPTLGGTP